MMTLEGLKNTSRVRWSGAGLAGLLFLLLFPLCAYNAFGQTFSASITGTVTDPSGAAIPGAYCTAIQTWILISCRLAILR
jgi:hypothetical protein